MREDKLGLTELESKIVFLAELAEKSGNPFFSHGIYRGEIKDDMLAFNSSILLSVNQNKCSDIIKKLLEKSVLLIRPGTEGARSYTNYYYHAPDFVNKEKTLEKIGNHVLENAINLISENPQLMETLGCALVYRYKGWKYVNKEKIAISSENLNTLIRNCLFFKNRFVYTGALSGIIFFIPNAQFFELVNHLNKRFLAFFFKKVEETQVGVAGNYEEIREKILSDLSFRRLGLDSYDANVVDYIFDLAKPLQIPIPTQYGQLYDQYKESIISLKVFEKISPLLRGSIETLEDSIRHYKKGTLPDLRLGLISIDNTIELILRNHLLKKDVSIEDVKKISFDRLLKKCRDIGIVADNLTKFKQIHAARNQLYHMPLGIVDKLLLKDAINLAKNLFEEVTNEKLKVKL